jgi:cysteine desulfurase
MDSLYLDNNATTPVLPAVWEAMRPYLTDVYGNPASAHRIGRRARQALEDAREGVAALLGAHTDEVLFSSGATESNNLALFGLCGDPPGRFLASPIEHPSVLEPLRRLGERGFVVDRLPVDAEGVVPLAKIAPLSPVPKARGEQDCRLLTVMLANHETGAIQPVRALAELFGRNIPFHCDATQAAGKVPIDFHDLGVTTLSLSAHKFHGPKGVGVLLLRRGTVLTPQQWGGHQQQGRRPGTEPVALAVALTTALRLAMQEREHRWETVTRLRRRFLDRLRAETAPVALNGPEESGLPHTINVSFPGVKADALLMALDLAGVACSTGSACSSGSLLPSPVLMAMDVGEERLRSAMRFSLSALLNENDIDEAARRIIRVVRRLRDSPAWTSDARS